MRQSRRWHLPLVTALSIALGLALLGNAKALAARWGENYFPNLPVVTHQGDTVQFYQDLIKGRLVAINFIYASCPDLCSLSTARLAQVIEWLGDSVGRDIFIYSITIDPANDTQQVLRKYAEGFHARDGWLFLTGKPENIDLIRYKLGERSRTLSEHRSDMVIGNDRTGEWRRISAFGNLKMLTQRLREMDPAVRAIQRSASPETLHKTRDDYLIENRPGEAMFLKACSFCHTIGRGDRFGPDLQGVTNRREHDWLVRYLTDPHTLLASKDPAALELDAKYPNVTMPYLGLSEADAQDIITYLAAQTKRLAATAESTGFNAGQNQHPHHHHSQPHAHPAVREVED